jgi:formate hydrogenlyase subunit 4
MKIIIVIIQAVVLVLLSPLLGGLIRKIKNTLRMRRGAGVLQPYYNLVKLFSKEEVVSETASWIFTAAPIVMFSSVFTALLIVPSISQGWPMGLLGDFICVIFLLGLGRFFLALAALDTGSAFGGMGASREMFLSSFAEPAAMVAIFAASLKTGSTSFASQGAAAGPLLSTIIAGAALFLVSLAETSRLPIDNQETHLELTMVHEAMALEYSGRSLAILELAGQMKQILFFSLVSGIILPTRGAFFFGLKMLCLALIVSVLEVSIAKMRLFRAVDFLGFAFVLSGISLVIAAAGF